MVVVVVGGVCEKLFRVLNLDRNILNCLDFCCVVWLHSISNTIIFSIRNSAGRTEKSMVCAISTLRLKQKDFETGSR